MKKLLIVAAVAIIATAGFYEKKEQDTKEKDIAENTIVEELHVALAEQMVASFETTFQEQIDAFLHSDDFSQTVGWSKEEKQQLTESLQEYLASYEWDTQQILEVKDKVTELLNDSELLKRLKGITKEELDAKLAELLSVQESDNEIK